MIWVFIGQTFTAMAHYRKAKEDHWRGGCKEFSPNSPLGFSLKRIALNVSTIHQYFHIFRSWLVQININTESFTVPSFASLNLQEQGVILWSMHIIQLFNHALNQCIICVTNRQLLDELYIKIMFPRLLLPVYVA